MNKRELLQALGNPPVGSSGTIHEDSNLFAALPAEGCYDYPREGKRIVVRVSWGGHIKRWRVLPTPPQEGNILRDISFQRDLSGEWVGEWKGYKVRLNGRNPLRHQADSMYIFYHQRTVNVRVVGIGRDTVFVQVATDDPKHRECMARAQELRKGA